MNDKITIKNYLNSLEQKYNAVCFDIDGTLTELNSSKIDERAIKMIADLLKHKIPIVFITGRGSTGLSRLVEDIRFKLLNLYDVNNNELMRIYALTNDGARLFYTDGDRMFNKCIYISNDNKLNQLKIFDKKIDKETLYDICDVSYSKDSVNKKILNVRFVLKENDEYFVQMVLDLVNSVIKKNNLNELTVTRGVYKENNVIQVGTTNKNKAIEQAERIIGVPKASMMRIGDCGDFIGNDYSMLNCEQGYSVDKVSGAVDKCFPIFNDNGIILKGINATLYLISKAKILPTICLESSVKDVYTKKYAKVEYDIFHGKNKYLSKYNQKINENFETIYGINDIFDCNSGSVKIPMYEWEMIDSTNPLKMVFATGTEKSLFYALRDDFNYLLRGSKTYYYFLANRQSVDGKDFTSKDNVKEWYENNIEFLNSVVDALNIGYDYSDIMSKKLVLGLLDNIRNIVLLLINHKLVSVYNEDNILININSNENNDINNLYKNLYLTELLMAKICFENKFKLNICDVKNVVISINEIMKKENFNFAFGNHDYSKEYRAYREIDNFAENYLTVKIDADKKHNNQSFGVCGMCYGGIELPVIYKVINHNIEDILLFKFSKNISGYKNKQLVDLRKFNINNYDGITRIGNIKSSNIVLLDDNILTGKTMQLAINSFYDDGLKVENINVVRYPDVNRINQMFMKNHGAVDYNLFFEYVTGLCFQSPYSWVDFQENETYLDSLGIFDLNREKIINCLIKNHDYKENSEVSFKKRRLKK